MNPLLSKSAVQVHGRADFPPLLAGIFDPPYRLFAWGEWGALLRPCVAIVGTRKATPYGENIAYEWAKALALQGYTIVSGLAFGIDAAAHRGALDGGGVTVAVIAQALGHLQPRQHQGLAEQIVRTKGLILSENGGVETVISSRGKADYLIRNRLIAGLSLGTLVVEAGIPSGAINTGYHAREMGRELMVVPGRVDDSNSAGCFKLYREGASFVSSPQEVVQTLGGQWKSAPPVAVPAPLKSLFEQLQKSPLSAAALSELFFERGPHSKLEGAPRSLTELYKQLAHLEGLGLIRLGPDQRFHIGAAP